MKKKKIKENELVQHVFIIGAKSIGQYGGYETFVDKLSDQHKDNPYLKYHIACKANGDGYMDEGKLSNIKVLKKNFNGMITEFTYHNAHVFKLACPKIGPAVAIYYDWMAVVYGIHYCKKKHIENPIFYILTCRIGFLIKGLVKRIQAMGGKYYLNPDGHEWKRHKWSVPVRRYWKWSEKKMVSAADVVVCDSKNIKKYIIKQYKHPCAVYIAYGADIEQSSLSDEQFKNWLDKNNLKMKQYYLIVGRFVPENNYETMLREFMACKSKKKLVVITNMNDKLKRHLELKLHFSTDQRIKFVGTIYEQALLKKIRENAYAYIHGHEVGGTNPSLLEALGSTDLNLLLAVGFNKEVALDTALYWNKNNGDLSRLINKVDLMDNNSRREYGIKAKERIRDYYSWERISERYRKLFLNVKDF